MKQDEVLALPGEWENDVRDASLDMVWIIHAAEPGVGLGVFEERFKPSFRVRHTGADDGIVHKTGGAGIDAEPDEIIAGCLGAGLAVFGERERLAIGFLV